MPPKQLHKLKPDESRDEDGKRVYLTPAEIERLHERLIRLNKAIPTLATEAARTAAYGDRSDNAEYKQAKGALRRTHAEIFELEQMLKRAVAIESGPDVNGKIKLGSRVVLESPSGLKEYKILGPAETDPSRGRISFESPLGSALIGRGVGEIIVLKGATGIQEYKIIEVQ